MFVRELTGGIYFGKPSERRSGPDGREAVDTLVYTEGRSRASRGSPSSSPRRGARR